MDRNLGKDRDEIMEDFADDLLGKNTNSSHREISPRAKSHGKTIILWAVGILILIAIISFLFGGGTGVSKKELDSVTTRLTRLEKKTENLEGVEGKIAYLEKEDKELEKSAAKMDKSIGFLISQINTLNKKIDSLQKSMSSTSVGTKPSSIKKVKQAPQAKSQYHEVRAGDSLYSIAQKYGISVDELCRINNITKKHVIQPGQKLKVVLSERQ
jgi:LysM repeat protein